ncbi:hypothetical protein RchiOBHm_Chr3g0481031 [Rosa chinensis]|uniref:Uncharacterized protein n=1 Tax=Rosa chinensis TaxID=74649 RepID=A0A2P6RDU6_ROSCH|nr:hypothetical protein RchiOBHm_Chr3g0481031 [Rosa chinensis]
MHICAYITLISLAMILLISLFLHFDQLHAIDFNGLENLLELILVLFKAYSQYIFLILERIEAT